MVKEDLFAPYEAAQRAVIEDEGFEGMDAVRATLRVYFDAMRRMTSWMSLANELAQMPRSPARAPASEGGQEGGWRDPCLPLMGYP